MAEQVGSFVNRALRDAPAEVPGWGSKVMGALRGAWDSAAPGGSGDMAGDAVKGWKGTLPERGPVVTSSPDGAALRATDPVIGTKSDPAIMSGRDPHTGAASNWKSNIQSPSELASARVQPGIPAPGPAIGDTIAQAATDSGMKPLEAAAPEVRAAATPISQTVAQAGAEAEALGQQPLGAKNPAWGAGQSPEAKAWQARQAGGAGVPPEVPPTAAGATPPPKGPSGMRGAASKVGGYIDKGIKAATDFVPGGKYVRAAANQFPKLGALAGGLSAYDAIEKANEGTTPEQVASKGEGGWRESPVRAGLAEFGDNMGFGKGREFGTALGAGAAGFVQGKGGLRGKAANAWDMAKQGWNDAAASENKVFGNGTAAKPSSASAAPSDSGSVGKSDVGGGDSNATGGFKRTGDDTADYNNANAYLQLRGFDPNRTTPAPGHVGHSGDGDMSDALNGLRTGIGANGPFGSMAALQIGGSMARMRSNAAGMQLRGAQIQATNDLARSQMALGQYNKDREYNTGREDNAAKVNDTALEDYVKSSIPGQNTSLIGGEKAVDYTNRVGTEKAKLADQINYTLGDTSGKRLGQLDGTHLQQLLMGAKLKSKLEASRGSAANWASDFFGNKRVDSKNLYSYMPSGAEPTMIPNGGGYRIQTRNGNTMTVKNAADGGFNWTGPNDPSDADVMELIAPYIKKLRAQGK